MMNSKEDLLFIKKDINSLDVTCADDPVSPSNSDRLGHHDDVMISDVIVNNGDALQLTTTDSSGGGKRKLSDSPTDVDDTDGDALSPRKHLHHANHHNNNDVTFVLIDDDGGGNTGPEDLASGDEEVRHSFCFLNRVFSGFK